MHIMSLEYIPYLHNCRRFSDEIDINTASSNMSALEGSLVKLVVGLFVSLKDLKNREQKMEPLGVKPRCFPHHTPYGPTPIIALRPLPLLGGTVNGVSEMALSDKLGSTSLNYNISLHVDRQHFTSREIDTRSSSSTMRIIYQLMKTIKQEKQRQREREKKEKEIQQN